MSTAMRKGRRASAASISELEASVGIPLPPDYLQFVAQYDGAEPDTNIFTISQGNESGVNEFIPVSDIPAELQRLGKLPEKSFPIAWAEGGNYVVLACGEASGVYFWDHELHESMTKLSATFGGFLESLRPFDARSVELRPGQVKSAWIDPEFLQKWKT